MMRPAIIRFISFQIIGLMAFGCLGLENADQGSPRRIPKEESVALKDSDLKSVLEYNRRLSSLSEEDLKQEYSRAQQTFSETHQPSDRLRLILLLSLPQAPFKDYDRSLTLLQDSLNAPDGRDSVLKDFLSSWSSLIQELKTLDQKLRDEKKQREALQEKLEELKAIEKNLLERDNKKKP